MYDFNRLFQALTGYPALRWQQRLFERLASRDIPSRVMLPTGLGKTSVIPIWLIALANSAAQGGAVPLPRRLVYVVNRRTVVDQATDTVDRLRERLLKPDDPRWSEHAEALRSLADALRQLGGANQDDLPLAVSTLRGELADNAEWKVNPARPAIIVGTIDMIGSKLLFSGYGDGRYGRAHHAGLIGQDTLIVHDEAHLTPAFSALLAAVEHEQQRESGLRPVRVVELSATSRANATAVTPAAAFGLEVEDETDSPVQQRINAEKRLSLVPLSGNAKDALTQAIVAAALEYRESRCRVLIYVREPKTADEIAARLRKQLGRGGESRVGLLTGTLRGYERDQLADSDLFHAFKADRNRPPQPEETLYLVSTSAGEVGIDLDADHLVCDLTTLDSMIQRFGRVNRLGVDSSGQARQANITVIVAEVDDKDPLKNQLEKTAQVLGRLPKPNGEYDASPQAVAALLRTEDAQAAFAPVPEILPATDILFDAWSLTSIDGEMPGRPAVAEYLHGAAEWEPPETFVAWRTEVRHLANAQVDGQTLTEWFEACPILAHERLRDRTDRAHDALEKLLKEHRKKHKDDAFDLPVVLLNERGAARFAALSELVEKPKGRDPLAYATIVLPIEAGGLNAGGMLDASVTEPRENLDVAEELPGRVQAAGATRKRERWLFIRDADGERWRHLLNGQETDQPPANLRERESVTLKEPPEDEEDEGDTQALVLLVEPREAAAANPEQARLFRETLTRHQERVAAHAEQIARALGLPDDLREALVLAARWHDRGKDRPVWQRYARNTGGGEPLAKSDRYGKPGDLNHYRHEFGSLLEAAGDPQIRDQPARDLILHLIAAHHGRARPHFEEQAFDNEGPTDPATGQRRRPTTRENETAAVEALQRFGRLQQRFGRWGLAWLESLLRCADALASTTREPATVALSPHRANHTDSGAPREATGETAA